MNKTHNSNLTPYSQKLRKEMTGEEKHLWYDFLKQLKVTVHRQKIINNYIIDFYIPKVKIAIELDGEQHYADKKVVASDKQRDRNLRELGIVVLRYSNLEIKRNFRGVCEDIYAHVYKEE